MPSGSVRVALFGVVALLFSRGVGLAAEDAWDAAIRKLLEAPPPNEDWRQHVPYMTGPPPDDAPLEELVAWWTNPDETDETADPHPSPVAQMRLLEALRKDPRDVVQLLEHLPRTPEGRAEARTILQEQKPRLRGHAREVADEWLRANKPRSDEELLEQASRARYTEGISFEGEEALRELLRRNREKGREVLARHARGDDARLAAFALRRLHEDSVRTSSTSVEEERLRLKRIAADGDAPALARASSVEALMAYEWPGRDEWFLALFGDPAMRTLKEDVDLLEPLVQVVAADPDRWIPRLAPLVSSPQEAVRDNAVQCLVQFHLEKARWDALRPLLPWLEDAAWSDASDRLRLIQSLDRFKAAECVPGLLKVLEEGAGFEQRAAADALAFQKDARAIPALKNALGVETDERTRDSLQRALIALDGVPEAEAAEGIDAYLWQLEAGEEPSRQDPRVHLGSLLASRPDRIFVRRLIAGLADGRVQSSTLLLALEHRKLAVEHAKDLLTRLQAAKGYASGTAAVLLGAGDAAERVLAGDDVHARAALLACARSAGMPLGIERVAPLVQSDDDLVKRSATAYLASDARPEARASLFASRPGEYLIVGDRTAYDPGHFSFDDLGKWGSRLAAEVRREDGPDEIVALLSAGYWGDDGQIIVKLRGGEAELVQHLDEDRYRRSPLRKETWEEVRAFLDRTRFFDLPFLETAVSDGIQYEALDLRRQGGQRVFMNNPDHAAASPYHLFVRRMSRLAADLEAPVRYAVEDTVPGARVLLHDVRAIGIHASGRVMQVLVRDSDEDVKSEAWRILEGETLGAETPPPPDWPDAWMDFINEGKMLYPNWNSSPWQARLGDDLVLAGPTRRGGYDPALRRCTSRGEEVALLAKGTFADPIVTPDGKWVIVAMAGRGGWAKPNPVVRIRVESGKTLPVEIPAADTLMPIAWVAARSRVLIERVEAEDAREASPEFFLADPTTGKAEPVRGELEPWFHQKAHPLQATDKSDEVWAAIPKDGETRVGRYDTGTFTFTAAASIPGLEFTSDRMWVDEGSSRLLVAKHGDVIALPFKA